MPETKPNQIARVFAVFALLGAFVLVVATIATSGGDSDGGGGDDQAEASGPTKRGQRALNKGVWVVGKGDTLVSISEETGVELEELIQLNAAIDPQTLNTGERISLRQGATADGGGQGVAADGAGESSGTGTGVGDGGPTGAGSEDTDG